MKVTRRRGQVELRLDAVDVELLTAVATDLLVLLGDGEEDDLDPLVAMVGLPPGEVQRPADPALARLFPDAYGDDDEAASEFRRYTETDLRAGKRANAGAVLAMLAPLAGTGGRLQLDPEGCDAWLGCLNDLRLVLGTRLEVTEDDDLGVREDDPRAPALQLYAWLGAVQESLLRSMLPRGAR